MCETFDLFKEKAPNWITFSFKDTGSFCQPPFKMYPHEYHNSEDFDNEPFLKSFNGIINFH